MNGMLPIGGMIGCLLFPKLRMLTTKKYKSDNVENYTITWLSAAPFYVLSRWFLHSRCSSLFDFFWAFCQLNIWLCLSISSRNIFQMTIGNLSALSTPLCVFLVSCWPILSDKCFLEPPRETETSPFSLDLPLSRSYRPSHSVTISPIALSNSSEKTKQVKQLKPSNSFTLTKIAKKGSMSSGSRSKEVSPQNSTPSLIQWTCVPCISLFWGNSVEWLI